MKLTIDEKRISDLFAKVTESHELAARLVQMGEDYETRLKRAGRQLRESSQGTRRSWAQ